MPNAPEFRTALRVIMMPRDTNQFGTIFGGVILSYIDQAGFIEARRHGLHRWVTASMEHVDFRSPVLTGDVISLQTATIKTGTKSVTVKVSVIAERDTTRSVVQVTEATLTMVSVDEKGRSIPFKGPPTIKPPRRRSPR